MSPATTRPSTTSDSPASPARDEHGRRCATSPRLGCPPRWGVGDCLRRADRHPARQHEDDPVLHRVLRENVSRRVDARSAPRFRTLGHDEADRDEPHAWGELGIHHHATNRTAWRFSAKGPPRLQAGNAGASGPDFGNSTRRSPPGSLTLASPKHIPSANSNRSLTTHRSREPKTSGRLRSP